MKRIYVHSIHLAVAGLLLVFLFGTVSVSAQTTLIDGTGTSTEVEHTEDIEDESEESVSDDIAEDVNITEDEARNFAEDAYAGGGEFTNIELERYSGYVIYTVEFTEANGNQVDVRVDSETGAILDIEDHGSESDRKSDEEGKRDNLDVSATTFTTTSTAEVDSEIKLMETVIQLLNQIIALLEQRSI